MLLWQAFDELKATVTTILITMVSLINCCFLCCILKRWLGKSYFWNSLVWQVDKDRDGQIIDRTLVKNVLDIYIELGHDPARNQSAPDPPYEKDFEDAFRQGTIDYYSKKAQTWIVEDTCPEYMLKVTEELL